MNFADRLHDAIERCGNAALIGLDPHLDKLPAEFAVARDPNAPRAERAAAMGDFCCALIDLAAGRVPAVKPQSAFFELLGGDGVEAFERVVGHAHDNGLLVIGDVKRGDIASTAGAYARAMMEDNGGDPKTLCDAVTVNAFLGLESIAPFLEVCTKNGTGIYVLVRTSNPGSAEFQLCGEPTLSERIADAVNRWGADLIGDHGLSSVGAVVGATHPRDLAALRERMPKANLLVPGYGAQGGSADDIAAAFLPGGQGALVNSSRGISFAYAKSGRPESAWRDASSAAIDAMIEDLRSAAGMTTA